MDGLAHLNMEECRRTTFLAAVKTSYRAAHVHVKLSNIDIDLESSTNTDLEISYAGPEFSKAHKARHSFLVIELCLASKHITTMWPPALSAD